jgi:NAD(P)-dependent dehydrogenase (short-subunit alcohol dehydrogenase family)
VVEQAPVPDLLLLSGKVAVVTGGAQGIGEGIVGAFVYAGSSVVVADINGDGAERVAAGCAIGAVGMRSRPTFARRRASPRWWHGRSVGRRRCRRHGAGGDFRTSAAGAAGVQSVFDVASLRRLRQLNLKATFFVVRHSLAA